MTMINSCGWSCLLNLTCIFFSFQIIGRFKVEYYNFSSWFDIETCIAFTTIAFKNNQIFKSLFDNVTCGKENMELRYSIRRNLYNISIHLHCDNTSEVHNMTSSADGKVELYCETIMIWRFNSEGTQQATPSFLRFLGWLWMCKKCTFASSLLPVPLRSAL